MTLIEIMITIVIFGVGILTILSILTGSLSLGRRSRNRTTATMLAKEGLEMVVNLRDTSLDKAQPRGCLTGQCASLDLAAFSGHIIVDQNLSTGVPEVKNVNYNPSNDAPSRLYTTGDSILIYTHNGAGGNQRSSFRRWITITPANSLGDQTFVNSQIKKIISVVEYEQLGGTSRVELESFIGLTR